MYVSVRAVCVVMKGLCCVVLCCVVNLFCYIIIIIVIILANTVFTRHEAHTINE